MSRKPGCGCVSQLASSCYAAGAPPSPFERRQDNDHALRRTATQVMHGFERHSTHIRASCAIATTCLEVRSERRSQSGRHRNIGGLSQQTADVTARSSGGDTECGGNGCIGTVAFPNTCLSFTCTNAAISAELAAAHYGPRRRAYQ